MDGGRVAKGVGLAILALLMLPVVLYAALLAINWSDRAPSADARRLQALVDARPQVPDAANGALYLLGLSVERGESPQDWAARRRDWLARFDPAAPPSPATLPGRDFDQASVRQAYAEALGGACEAADRACADALRDREARIDALLQDQDWLLQRYLALLAHPAWQEHIPSGPAAPLPAYGHALAGQRLLFLQAWRQARHGDAAGVRDLLGRDARFWRMALASSDLLISKMIATAALERNFAFGTLALGGLPRDGVAAAVPAEWRREIGPEERSLLRALAGEWRWAVSTVRMSREGRIPGSPERQDDLRSRLAHSLLQVQDTSNRQATRMVRLVDTLDVPWDRYPQALAQARRDVAAAEPGWLDRVYNPIGRILASIAAPAYLDYPPRVADLEGQRRAALLVASLRADGVDEAGAPAAIAASPLRDPYTGGAFGWDGQARAVVFTGLQRAAGRQHTALVF